MSACPETTDLARRAVACRGWERLPGTLLRHEHADEAWRVSDVPPLVDGFVEYGHDSPSDWGPAPTDLLPDLDDAATLGCLLALVREAWGDPCIYVGGIRTVGGGTAWFVYGDRGSCLASGPTEAAALVAALEAAP